MMTSTFPTSRSDQSLKNGLQKIKIKRDALNALEAALKKRVNELKELCLKEGELTGHLPIDYPLQPREPIPQIRRRINYNNNNLNEKSGIMPSCSVRSKPQTTFAISNNANLPFPSRPTSTNSTSSSISTASSNKRFTHRPLNNGQFDKQTAIHGCCPKTNTDQINTAHGNLPTHYDQSMIPNHFKRPFNMPRAQDDGSSSLMRTSSTASSSSSSGSGASSTISAPIVPNLASNGGLNMNLHMRSYSENTSESKNLPSNKVYNVSHLNSLQRQQLSHLTSTTNQNYPPARPPRGINHVNSHTNDEEENLTKHLFENQDNNKHSEKSNHVFSEEASQNFNICGVSNFQPYYEETKPFQMSDFYKYSTKHHPKVNAPPEKPKTTRQLQDDVLKKNSLKFSTCDDQIQASVRLIEKSGQKLIEATAKAIAGNPGLAEKLNNILPNGDKY